MCDLQENSGPTRGQNFGIRQVAFYQNVFQLQEFKRIHQNIWHTRLF